MAKHISEFSIESDAVVIHVCSDGLVIGKQTDEEFVFTLITGDSLEALAMAVDQWHDGERDSEDTSTFTAGCVQVLQSSGELE